VDKIKSHPFFRGVDWDKLRMQRAPFIPQLSSITDTSYFPMDEDDSSISDLKNMDVSDNLQGARDLAFVGYTFKRWETVRHQL
jgi:protein-serine/threonine kinase